MKKKILILMLLSTELTFGQIKNGGFEIWNSVYTNIYSTVLDTTYAVPNPVGGIIGSWTFYYPTDSFGYGISRTTDSYSGNYSLILHNWYNYARQSISYRDTLSCRPQYLQGYFKYIKGGTHAFAQGLGQVTLTRFNGTSNDTIATGSYLFDTTASFTPFQLTLNYISALNPDSISLFFICSTDENNYSTTVVATNLLYLDDLTLSSSPLGLEDVNSNENFVWVYPNPIARELNIQNNSSQQIQFTLYNSLGEKTIGKLLTYKTNTIDLSNYSTGIYFYNINSDKNIIKTGKIIKQ